MAPGISLSLYKDINGAFESSIQGERTCIQALESSREFKKPYMWHRLMSLMPNSLNWCYLGSCKWEELHTFHISLDRKGLSHSVTSFSVCAFYQWRQYALTKPTLKDVQRVNLQLVHCLEYASIAFIMILKFVESCLRYLGHIWMADDGCQQ